MLIPSDRRDIETNKNIQVERKSQAAQRKKEEKEMKKSEEQKEDSASLQLDVDEKIIPSQLPSRNILVLRE